MTLIEMGEIVKGASGSIGGTTFSRNRYGPYIRAKTVGVNPNTALQQAVRNAFSDITEQWNSVLTEVQRVAWNLYGASVVMKNALGQEVFLTGFNHFVRSNIMLVVGGQPIVAAGPTTFSLPETDGIFSISASEAAQQISVGFDVARPWVTEAGAFLLLFQMKPQIGSRNYLVGPTRQIEGVVGKAEPAPTSPVTPAAAYVVSEGQKMIAYGRILRADGRLSEPFQSTTTIAA